MGVPSSPPSPLSLIFPASAPPMTYVFFALPIVSNCCCLAYSGMCPLRSRDVFSIADWLVVCTGEGPGWGTHTEPSCGGPFGKESCNLFEIEPQQLHWSSGTGRQWKYSK